MIRMMACAAILAAALPQSDEEKPKHPPYTVFVTAKTKRGWRESYLQFQERVKKTIPEAKLIGREVSPDDTAGWEVWLFEMTAQSKLDLAIFPRLFGEQRMGKIELEITGLAERDAKTKVIWVTSLGEKVKVKLMNRPRKDPHEIIEDKVGQVAATMAELGKSYFIVRGEIVTQGGTHGIILESFRAVEGPAKK